MDVRLCTIYLVNCLVGSIYTSVVPFYPMIAYAKGAQFITVGLIIATTPIVTCIASLTIGSKLGQIGRNKTLLGGIVLAVRTKQGVSLVVASLSIDCEV
jgi:MFS family permease